MSMTVHYKHISPWLLDLFASEPELVESFTVLMLPKSREPGVPDEATIRKNLLDNKAGRSREKILEEFTFSDGLIDEMKEQIKSISPENAPKILNETKSNGFSLGKYFENVQFHISGEITDHGTSLLSRAVTGGQDIGNDVWPYGPATFLTREDVEKAAKNLSKISEKEFLTKYSTDDWDKQTTQYALVYFNEFVSYYNEAAKAGHAMLVWGA